VDVTPILTHRYSLEQYREAFLAGHDQGASGAVKMLFDYRSREARPRLGCATSLEVAQPPVRALLMRTSGVG